jgi:hypothetical protein
MSRGPLRPETPLTRSDREMQGIFQKWKQHGKV